MQFEADFGDGPTDSYEQVLFRSFKICSSSMQLWVKVEKITTILRW